MFATKCIEIQNNKSIYKGGSSQQVIDMHSRRLGKTFLECYLHLFKDPNGHTLIDSSTFAKHNQMFLLSHIIGMNFVILQSEIFIPLPNPAFALGLLHANNVPDLNDWNKFTSQLEFTHENEYFFQ